MFPALIEPPIFLVILLLILIIVIGIMFLLLLLFILDKLKHISTIVAWFLTLHHLISQLMHHQESSIYSILVAVICDLGVDCRWGDLIGSDCWGSCDWDSLHYLNILHGQSRLRGILRCQTFMLFLLYILKVQRIFLWLCQVPVGLMDRFGCLWLYCICLWSYYERLLIIVIDFFLLKN